MTATDTLSFKSRRLSINASTIKTLARMENPRPLRESHVLHLVRVAKAGKPFEGCFVVNDVGGGGRERFRLIDGNHRLEAVKRVLQDDPSFRMEVEFHIYDHLTEVQEIDLFDRVNRVTNVTNLDRLTNRRAHIPIMAMMEGDFPFTVTFRQGPIKEGMSGFSLLKAYVDRHRPWRRVGVDADARQKFFQALAALGPKDHAALKAFGDAFLKGFGQPASTNPMSKFTGLEVAVKSYFQSVDGGFVEADDLARRWKNAFDDQVRLAVQNTSIGAFKFAHGLLVTKMNEGHKKNLAPTLSEFAAKWGDAP
jgi:hypothetical protein